MITRVPFNGSIYDGGGVTICGICLASVALDELRDHAARHLADGTAAEWCERHDRFVELLAKFDA